MLFGSLRVMVLCLCVRLFFAVRAAEQLTALELPRLEEKYARTLAHIRTHFPICTNALTPCVPSLRRDNRTLVSSLDPHLVLTLDTSKLPSQHLPHHTAGEENERFAFTGAFCCWRT